MKENRLLKVFLAVIMRDWNMESGNYFPLHKRVESDI